MEFQGFETLLFERKDNVLTITMNNPAKLNAVGPSMHVELVRAFRELEGRHDIDVVVLTGAGKAFSAGGEIAHNLTVHDDQHRVVPEISQAKHIVLKLLDCEQLLVARINGDAIGFGATLALFCDITIAVDTARIADAHLKVGLVAGDGGAIVWPQLIGYARAKQYLLTGDPIGAVEAERIGLVNAVVPDDALDDAAFAFAQRLAAGAPLAVRYTKLAVNKLLKDALNTTFDAATALELVTFKSDDHAEALAAIRERRSPDFKGQ